MQKKLIWSIDQKNVGRSKEVDADYQINPLFETETPMPDNLLIPAWDTKTNGWYDAGQNVDSQLKPIMGMVANLMRENVDLKRRIGILEGGE